LKGKSLFKLILFSSLLTKPCRSPGVWINVEAFPSTQKTCLVNAPIEKTPIMSSVTPSSFPNVKLTVNKYTYSFFYFLGHHTESTYWCSTLALLSLCFS
jgi:hypothetical protein